MSDGWISFNRPYRVGTETGFIEEAIRGAHLTADGPFTQRCATWLEERLGARRALLVTSATAALEIGAMLMDLAPGDEVIMPSFTFVSTANAIALRGAVPVFVDIRADTGNLDESLVESAITPATRAILPVHYAGVGADMDTIGAIAERHGLTVMEDAAQGILGTYRDRPLGSIAPLAALSFHETKNVTCGEGGALLVNDEALVERAEIAREKGTDRSRFFRGQVDKYTWVDLGSSYALSDLNAAFLWGQLGAAEEITARRLAIWDRYHAGFAELEAEGLAERPIVPDGCVHNAHLYRLLVADLAERTRVIAELAARDVNAVFHYVPLHSSPAGRRLGRAHGALPVTDAFSERLVRLPLWAGMTDEQVDRVVATTCDLLRAGR